ncbi:hypothetical protein DI005_20730 [Prauserella sp. PE36]|uniref:hypothetical protein n=1 Tax=Prauserella sp. PE36 TaxID=1504709 RepID=UPI000DE43DEF|nr:hypothetical protein [Prauserella sp. PE36]RBM17957.1 hypothetical protein DI005_20730 [Prauserella sp. PE36]
MSSQRIPLTGNDSTAGPGLLPADTDIDDVILTGGERELIATWNTFHTRRVAQRVLDASADKPDADLAKQAFTLKLAETAPVTAVHALAANRRLIELLTGRRWYVMQEAREAGASWADIGAALDMTRQSAHEWYQRKIELQEKYVPDFHDAERARAVLDDASTPGASEGATKGEA